MKGRSCCLFIRALEQGIVWGLWKERNMRVFEDKKQNMWAVIDYIICEVSSWMLTNSVFKGCSLNDMVRDWITCISVYPVLRNPPILEWVPPLWREVQCEF